MDHRIGIGQSSKLFDDSLNVSCSFLRADPEEQLSPVILSTQPVSTSTVKNKKSFNFNRSALDKSGEILTGSDSSSSKTWTESTPSRESNVSPNHFNVSPICQNEKTFEGDVASSLEPLLQSHNLEWTSALASPFVCPKTAESLLKTAEKQVFCPSNNTRFVVSTNSSKFGESDSSTLNESKKSDSFLSKTEANTVANDSPLLIISRDNTVEVQVEDSLIKNLPPKDEAPGRSDVNISDSKNAVFENIIPSESVLFEKTKEDEEEEEDCLSPEISLNKSFSTPCGSKFVHGKKTTKSKITSNVVKCLFQASEGNLFFDKSEAANGEFERRDDEKTDDFAETEEEKKDDSNEINKMDEPFIERPKDIDCERSIKVPLLKSNFSQYCPDYSSQDFSDNTMNQIMSESIFLPSSPELSLSFSKERSNRKLSDKSPEESKTFSANNTITEDQASVPGPSFSSVGTKDKDDFVVPSIPVSKFIPLKTKSTIDQNMLLTKSDVIHSKSKLKHLIYLINDCVNTQALDVNICSNDILQDAFSFEETPSHKRNDKTAKSLSQEKSSQSSGFISFSSLVNESDDRTGSQKNVPSTSDIESDSVSRNIKLKSKSDVFSRTMSNSQMNKSKIDSNLYLVSDTQMFQIGELIDNAEPESVKSQSSFSFEISVDNITSFLKRKADNSVLCQPEKKQKTDLDSTISNSHDPSEDFEESLIFTQIPSTSKITSNSSSTSQTNYLCDTQSLSQFDSTLVFSDVPEENSISNTTVVSNNCDNVDKFNEATLSLGKNISESKIDSGICDTSKLNVVSSNYGFSTAGGKKISVSEKSLLNARQLLDSCNDDVSVKLKNCENTSNETKKSFESCAENFPKTSVSASRTSSSKLSGKITPEKRKTLGCRALASTSKQNIMTGFSTAGGKSVTVTENSLNEARQMYGSCDEGSPVKQTTLDRLSQSPTEKVSVSEVALNTARHLLERSEEKISEAPSSHTLFQNPDRIISGRPSPSLGFSTASGKKVSVSEKALDQARKLIESCDENAPVIQTSVAGFSTASGKKVAVSEKALNQARKLMESCDDEEPVAGCSSDKKFRVSDQTLSLMESCNENTPVRTTPVVGFSTASGKKVAVSEKALDQARKLMESCDKNTPVRQTPVVGFSAASGKEVAVPEKSLDQAQKLMGSCNENTPVRPTFVAGFSTASGKKVSVSEKHLDQARRLMESCDENTPVAGCSTASDKNVAVPEKSLEQARKLMGSCNENTPVRPTFVAGFSTASGKKVSVSEKHLDQARRLMESCDENTPVAGCSTASEKNVAVPEKSLEQARKLRGGCNENTPVRPTFVAGFSTASGKKVAVSEKHLDQAQKLMESCEETTLVRQTPVAGFSTASGKKVAVSEKALNQARKLMESCDENSPVAGCSTASDKKVSVPEKSLDQARNLMGSCNKNTPVRPTFVAGFSTASGKKVAVSEKAIDQARKLIDSCDETTPVRQTPVAGFSTASGKKVAVSEKALNQARKLMESCDENSPVAGCSTASDKKVSVPEKSLDQARNLMGSCNENTPVRPTFVAGFSTASGKKVAVSEKALDQARKLIDSCDENTPVSITPATGFSTASGKKVAVSEKALNQARKLMECCDENTPVAGCSTTSGKKVTVSEKALSQAQKLMESCDENTPVRQTPVAGFSTARGKKVTVSEKALSQAQKLMESCDENTPVRQTPVAGFSTARGKKVAVSEKSLDQAQKLLESCNENTPVSKTPATGFSTASGKNVSVSEIALNQARKVLECHNDVTSVTKTSGFNSEAIYKPPNPSEMSPSLAREVSESAAALMIDEENSESGSDWFSFATNTVANQASKIELNCKAEDEEDGSLSPEVCSHQNFGKMKRRRKLSLKKHRNSVLSLVNSPACSTPDSKSKSVGDLPRSLMFKKGVVYNSTPKIELSKKREREADICNSFRKRLKECSIGLSEDSNVDKVILERLKAAEEQDSIIDTRNKSKNVPRLKGSFFSRKSSGERLSLKRGVLGHRPKIYSEEELQSHGISETTIYVSCDNALEYRFSAWDLYSNEECEKNTDGISVGDGAKIILDENGLAGITEIKRGFLSSPGVDSSIVPEKWVENHYRWIVWKLACMELRFPQIFAGKYLTLDNLLFQLKYRYDREIDQTERPALRKILECDEAASKRQILCVAKVLQQTDGTRELELTDGWYSVKTVVDPAMVSLIQRGKIQVGTKLMTQGAELLHCEQGCDPLEVKENIRLKIHSNCTRRVKWHAKMGFCHDSGPIPIRLDSILCGGGTIGKLHIFVARVYPLLYLSKTDDGKSVLLNEKLESLQRANEERGRSKRMEALFNEVKQELERERPKRISTRKRSLSKVQLKSLTSGQELFEYFETALDPASVQLSDEQLNALAEYKRKEEEDMAFELRTRVNERLKSEGNKKNSSTPLLKVRVVEGKDSYRSSKSAALLTVWRPSEDVFSILKEGSFVNIYNVLPSSSRFGDTSLSSNFHTRYEVVSKDMNHPLVRVVTDFSRIAEPTFSEIDIVGVVVHVETAATSKTFFQKVYLSDLNKNFVAISFCNGLSAFGWGDVVRKNAVIACCNLQWAGGKVSLKIPLLFASEVSQFTGNPRMKHTESALQKLKSNPRLLNIQHFVSSREEELLAILDKSSDKNDLVCKNEDAKKHKEEMDVSQFMNGSVFSAETLDLIENVVSTSNFESSKLDDDQVGGLTPLQQKIRRLDCYSPATAPPLPKLHMPAPNFKLRKEFKVPTRAGSSKPS